MARKVKEVIISGDSDNRDDGKKFEITEMPAMQAEKWGVRACAALLRSGVNVPDDVVRRGIAGIAIVGLKGLMGLTFAEAEPLMDEMWGCVKIVEPLVTRAPTDDDIEEVTTILMLRSEVIELHLGFSIAGFLSKQWQESRLPIDGNG